MQQYRHIRGFSLVEVMMVLAIITIMCAFALPAKKYFFDGFSTRLAGSQLLYAIQLARSEAILRGEKVTLCGSVDQQTCSSEWREGYLIKSADKIISSAHFTSRNGALYWRHYPYYRETLEFLPTGFANIENGTFYFYSADQSKAAWAIVINQAGRARLTFSFQSIK